MPAFVDIDVYPHPALPDGCVARWKVEGHPESVTTLWYEPDDGPDGEHRVQAAWSDGRRTPATQVRIEDSAAGISLLVYGGDYGLRLQRDDGPERAEPYLIIAP